MFFFHLKFPILIPILQIVQYRQQSDLAFMLLVKSQNLDEPVVLDELMRYSLTTVSPSLGTADGFFNKNNKAALLHIFTDDNQEDISYPKCALHIQDDNALFHVLTNTTPTFGEICLQVLDQMVAKKDFIFSTDSYHADSIKAQERLRRGYSQCYLIQGPATRKLTSSYSWKMSRIKHSSANYYSRYGASMQQHLTSSNVEQHW